MTGQGRLDAVSREVKALADFRSMPRVGAIPSQLEPGRSVRTAGAPDIARSSGAAGTVFPDRDFDGDAQKARDLADREPLRRGPHRASRASSAVDPDARSTLSTSRLLRRIGFAAHDLVRVSAQTRDISGEDPAPGDSREAPLLRRMAQALYGFVQKAIDRVSGEGPANGPVILHPNPSVQRLDIVV